MYRFWLNYVYAARVAQSGERSPCKRRVPGSSPGLAAYFSSVLLQLGAARCTACHDSMSEILGESQEKRGSSVAGVTWVCTGSG